ncbi:hypothetical protein AB0M12_32825 [Nocardia vinacea]|uniref:hypothetical protein n=1 Tax=Nocardia vinacea TaxID=96468 RepID=UPI00343418F9
MSRSRQIHREVPRWITAARSRFQHRTGTWPETRCKILDIFEGTQQIQQLIVARRILGKTSAELK